MFRSISSPSLGAGTKAVSISTATSMHAFSAASSGAWWRFRGLGSGRPGPARARPSAGSVYLQPVSRHTARLPPAMRRPASSRSSSSQRQVSDTPARTATVLIMPLIHSESLVHQVRAVRLAADFVRDAPAPLDAAFCLALPRGLRACRRLLQKRRAGRWTLHARADGRLSLAVPCLGWRCGQS